MRRQPEGAGQQWCGTSLPAVAPVLSLGEGLRVRREQLGWSQSRLAQASGVSRTVVNEVERGRRSPSLRTYEKLQLALGLDVSAGLALLSTAVPLQASELLLGSLAAALVMGRQVLLADLAGALQVDVATVRAGVGELTDRLAAVGLAAVDDGVQVEVTVLAFAAPPIERLGQLEAVRILSPEAVMTLVVIGHLGEATRREVEQRRGTDTAGLLERLVHRGLLDQRTDTAATGRPNAYRLTTGALTLLGHATVESFQVWCRQQVAAAQTATAAADQVANEAAASTPTLATGAGSTGSADRAQG